MVRLDVLQEKISDSGITMVALANKTGIERATLYNRMKGVGEFTASEIVALVKVLHLTAAERDYIFFNDWVVLNTTK